MSLRTLKIIIFVYFIKESVQYPESNVGIVGGHGVSIEEVPFMASLRLGGVGHICGASIIHRQFLLTAAHCILPSGNYTIVVGTDVVNEGGKFYNIENIIVHENYENVTYQNDICIIKLSKPLEFNQKVDKIKLYEDIRPIKKGTVLQVTGWGYTKVNGELSHQLQQVSVPAVTKGACKNAYRWRVVKITSKMLCAGKPGKDSCQGDSGGPLTMDGVQVGLVSNGAECGLDPGVYTKIAAYKEWIAGVLQKNA